MRQTKGFGSKKQLPDAIGEALAMSTYAADTMVIRKAAANNECKD